MTLKLHCMILFYVACVSNLKFDIHVSKDHTMYGSVVL